MTLSLFNGQAVSPCTASVVCSMFCFSKPNDSYFLISYFYIIYILVDRDIFCNIQRTATSSNMMEG